MTPKHPRLTGLLGLAPMAGALCAAPPAQAQPRKDTAVLGMTLEPPGLDPTAGAVSAIAKRSRSTTSTRR